MNPELLSLLEILKDPASGMVKPEIESIIKKIERKFFMDSFKIEKLESTVKNVSILMNENLFDIETKSKEIEQQNEIIRQQKGIVENKQRAIIESITYALRIQKTILPRMDFFQSRLPDSFILYKPKDIIAGDFYWIEETENQLLFAVCDCTGHGVPGAMVSVICHNALNRAVREYGITEPAGILDKTTELLSEFFGSGEESISDGMDVSLCSYHKKSGTMEWAGANNPLWILRNGDIMEFLPDKQPVGKSESKKSFTNHRIDLLKGDALYLFSDGFSDQFGGEADKKYKKKNLKNLLVSIQGEPMNFQQNLLNDAFENWRGNTEQTDDVCIMGVKL